MSMLATAGLIGSAVASMASAGINAYQNYKNRESQEDINKITWEREDNAVQRRVEDLKKAGLSPVLAAGSAASAQQVTAPHTDLSGVADAVQNMPMNLVNIRQGYANIGQTKAQTALTNQQSTSEQYRQAFMGQQVKNLQAEKQSIDLRNSWFNADMSSQIGLRNGQLAHLAKDTLRIGQQTDLLKAQTAYEQTAIDKLLTDIDNAKILRDIQSLELNRKDALLNSQIWNNYTSGNPIKGLLGAFQSVGEEFVDNMRRSTKGSWRNDIDKSWYWENNKK